MRSSLSAPAPLQHLEAGEGWDGEEQALGIRVALPNVRRALAGIERNADGTEAVQSARDGVVADIEHFVRVCVRARVCVCVCVCVFKYVGLGSQYAKRVPKYVG